MHAVGGGNTSLEVGTGTYSILVDTCRMAWWYSLIILVGWLDVTGTCHGGELREEVMTALG
jgi:hypothetical protein